MSDLSRLQKQLDKLVREGAASGKITNIAERILVLSPSDVTALHTKAVSCMHQEKFGAALSTLEQLESLVHPSSRASRRAGAPQGAAADNNSFDAVTFYFHKAYCQYRMQQYSEVKATLCEPQNRCASASRATGDDYAAITHTPSRHLMAQTLYNLEDYRAAATMYAALLAESETSLLGAEERSELWVNYSAALAGCDADAALRSVALAPAELNEYDMWYNAAVAQSASLSDSHTPGDVGAGVMTQPLRQSPSPLQGVRIEDSVALELLRRAERACAAQHPGSRVVALSQLCALPHALAPRSQQTTTTTGVVEAEATAQAARMAAPLPGQPITPERRFFNDVVNIWVQMAFAYHQLSLQSVGRRDACSRRRRRESGAAATAILRLVLSLKPNSAVTAAIASVNWTALQGEKDLFDSLRRLKAAQEGRIHKRLTRTQNAAVLYNTALLHLYRSSVVPFKATVEQMMRECATNPLTHVLQLVLCLREGRRRRAPLKDSSSEKQSYTSGDEDGVVAVIQECVSHYEESWARLPAAHSHSHSQAITPALVATQLYLDHGELAQAVQTFAAARESHTRSAQPSPAALATMLVWRSEMGEAEAALLQLGHTLSAAAKTSSPSPPTWVLELTVWAVQYIMSVVDSCSGNRHSVLDSTNANNITGRSHERYDAHALTRAVVAMLRQVREAIPALRSHMTLSALLVQCLTRIDCDAAAAEAEKAGMHATRGAAGQSQVRSRSETGGNAATQDWMKGVEEGPSRAVLEALHFTRPVHTAASSSADESKGHANHAAGVMPGEDRAPQRRRRARVMRRPPKNKEAISGKPDPERWLPMSVRSYIKDLPERRKKELRRLRALEQEQKRRAVEKMRAAEAAASAEAEAIAA